MSTDARAFEDPEFAERFSRLREEPGNFNACIEMPCVLSLLPPISGTTTLDLGCGAGHLAEELVRRGANKIHAVDRSRYLIEIAQARIKSDQIVFYQEKIERFKYNRSYYDVVVSSLALQFVENIEIIFQNVAQALVPGGLFVFSLRHPMRTANPDGGESAGGAATWRVNDYGRSGPRMHHWLGEVISIYHRGIEDIFRSIRAAKLEVIEIREPVAERSLVAKYPKLQEAFECPPFIAFKCQTVMHSQQEA